MPPNDNELGHFTCPTLYLYAIRKLVTATSVSLTWSLESSVLHSEEGQQILPAGPACHHLLDSNGPMFFCSVQV